MREEQVQFFVRHPEVIFAAHSKPHERDAHPNFAASDAWSLHLLILASRDVADKCRPDPVGRELQCAAAGSFFRDDQWMCTIFHSAARRCSSMVSVLSTVTGLPSFCRCNSLSLATQAKSPLT